MIRYSVIQKAKNGNEEAIFQIIDFYSKKIKKISTNEEFTQMALIEVFKGIRNFKNIKK